MKLPVPLGVVEAPTSEMDDDETPDSLEEWASEAKEAFRAQERAIEDEIALVAMTDTWVCVTFASVAQRAAFVEALCGEADERALDGEKLAARLGIEIPAARPMKRPRVAQTLADLSLPVPLGANANARPVGDHERLAFASPSSKP